MTVDRFVMGDTLQMHMCKWFFTDVVQVDGEKKISWIIQFIRKYLKLEQSDALFLYVNQAFSPSPDQTVSNLNECFGSADNKLVLYYSRSECWG